MADDAPAPRAPRRTRRATSTDLRTTDTAPADARPTPADGVVIAPPSVMVATASLLPYARNAKKHPPEQVAAIAASIREFGFLAPVVSDGANGLLAGHGRVLAAHLLQMPEVPVVEAAHLSEAQRRAYVLADNKIGELAQWDTDMLRVEFADLQLTPLDVTVTGFSMAEVEALLREPIFAPGTQEEQSQLDTLAPLPTTCPECGHTFNAREHVSQ